ncbi:MAG: hypothetical protein WC622_16755, partial [Pedobacter sp.]|uniref:hypothetical protein n=1 Tax=Pedobacter sp. TaxID=1411316 RepID=UPI00356540F3
IYWTAYIKRDKSLRPSERRDILAKKRSFELEDAICRCFVAFIYGSYADVEEVKENKENKENKERTRVN